MGDYAVVLLLNEVNMLELLGTYLTHDLVQCFNLGINSAANVF